MQEIGVVEKVNTRAGTAKVTFPRRTECEKCGMCMKHKNGMTVSITVKNTLSAAEGDRVAVGMKDGFVLRAAFIVYVIPVILVGITLALGRNLNELLLLGLVVVALLAGLAIAIISDRLIRKKGKGLPTMESIVWSVRSQLAPQEEPSIEESLENKEQEAEQTANKTE